MIEAAPILTGGGTVTLLVALSYIGKMVLDWRKTKPRRERAITASVSDAMTTNAILLSALKEERADNASMVGEIAELRAQNSSLYQHARQQRLEYESELAELRKQLQTVAEQLDGLQRRLHDTPLPVVPPAVPPHDVH